MKTKLLSLLLLAATVASFAFADQEALPSVYVAANGAWYAKCIPSGSRQHREVGKTLVYLAERDGDSLIQEFNWYSPRIFITGWGGGYSIVRLGPWPRGRTVSHDDLAVSFYRNGELLRRYSTLDLAGESKKVEFSVSHYSVIEEVVGFVHIYTKAGKDTLSSDPDYGFEIVLHDGQHIVFDPKTGERVLMESNMFTKRATSH